MSASLTDQATPAAISGCVSSDVGNTAGGNIFDTLVDDLQSEVTSDGKSRISQVQAIVERMSDLERLLLYLQLPNGPAATGPDAAALPAGGGALQLSNQLEQSQAFTWIQSHLEEDASICLRKDEVYNDYRCYCDSHGQKALNTADFGKVMKRAFPNVKPRRLGQRGQSKYCYGGLRKKTDLPHPVMPDLSLAELECANANSGPVVAPAAGSLNTSGVLNSGGGNCGSGYSEDAIYSEIILEWAQKIMGCQFNNLRQLAEHLVTNMYVNSRSPAAMTLFSSLQSRSQQRLSVSHFIELRAAAAAAAAAAASSSSSNDKVKVEATGAAMTSAPTTTTATGRGGLAHPMGFGACWSPDSLNSSGGGPLDNSVVGFAASPASVASSSTAAAGVPPSRPHLMPLPHQITKKNFRSPLPQQQQQQPPPPPPMLYHPQQQQPHRSNPHQHHSTVASSSSSASAVQATNITPSPSSTTGASKKPTSSSLNPSPGKKVCSERRFQPLGVPLNAQLLEQEVSSTEQHYIPLMSPMSSHRGGCSPAPHWGPPSAVSPHPSVQPPAQPPQSSQQSQQQQQQQPAPSQSFGISGVEPISLPPAFDRRSPSPQFPPVSPEQYLPALPRIGTSPLPSNLARPLASRRSPMPTASNSSATAAGIDGSPAGRSTVSSSSSPQQQGQQLLLLR